MSETPTSIRFEDLSAFDKPYHCDLILKCTADTIENDELRVTLGYRREGTEIYYEDRAIAGYYPLPKPLEQMSFEDFDHTFPSDKKFITKIESFQTLWYLSQPPSNI